MTPRSHPLALLAGLFAAVLLSAVARGSEPQPPTAGRSVASERPGPSPVRPRVWWQAPAFRDGLEIDAAQTEALDRALDAALAERREAGAEYRRLRSELTAAVTEKDGATRVERILADLERAAGRLARIEAELVVAVLGILTPQQVAGIQERHPRLLQRSWLTGFAGGRPGGGARALPSARTRSGPGADG